MRLKPEQLTAALQSRGLAPVYWISGDEPLQMKEASDAVREFARRNDVQERVVLTVEGGFDWSALTQHLESLSLFGSRRLIELRLPQPKLDKDGTSLLKTYCQRPVEENTVLIISPKLDRKALQAQWLKAVDQIGVVVQVWPIDASALPRWIIQRMAARQIHMTTEAAALVAERVEGNLLAAHQELEMLCLLLAGDRIDADDVIGAVADCARYDVFDLVQSALSGDAARTLRVLYTLRVEGIEPALINWALTRELRTLGHMSRKLEAGASPQEVLNEYRVWRNRAPGVKRALREHSRRALQAMLLRMADIERMIKGVVAGNPWDELTKVSLELAGTELR